MSIVALGAGDPFVVTIEGIEQVQSDLDTLSDSLKSETSLTMMTDVGMAVQGWIRDNIILNFYRHPTGTLWASVYYAALPNDQGAACFVGPDDSQLPYTAIHEYGGDIYPVTKKYLSWVDTSGKRHFSKHVKMPARPYIRPAFEDHQEDILNIMMEDIYYAIASGAASL